MRKISVFFILFSAFAVSVAAQKKHTNKTHTPEWAEKAYIHDLPPEYAHEAALILLNDVSLDYRVEGKGIEVYYTHHRIIKVIDERGIEMFNKVSIPVGSRTRVPLIKARTILPNGKVHEIAKDMIKVTKNEYGQYEIVFAMEGVERFAEVELLIKEIRRFSLFGNESFQYPVPVASTHFDISYPRDIVFEEKGYNGFPDAKDTLLNNRRHINIAVNDIPALHGEPNSYYNLHRQRAEYRIHKFIDENLIDSAKIYTWDHFARRLFDENYVITEKERAAVNKYLDNLNARPTNKEQVNIKRIEDGIKNNIVLYPDMDDENDDLDSIINNKAATPAGYIKLFAACFSQAEVKHELGATYNRQEHRFDKDFENWGNLDYYLFYFPNQKKFLSPTSVYYRYPVVPEEALFTKGVFCSIPPKTDVVNPLMEFKTVAPLPLNENQHNIAAGVSFNKDMDAQVDVAYSYTGYLATEIRKSLLLGSKDKEKDLIEKVVNIAGKPEQILKYTISNPEIQKSYSNAPLGITATVNTDGLVEKAGKTYLVKVGSLIGPHSSLYNEKNRVMPIDLDYPVSMSRTITINIPKGYKVLNPEALKMQNDYVNRDLKAVVAFRSGYELKKDKKNGDKLVVTIIEIYPQVHFSAADFERFKGVVNTAADFSKVTLLMTKKG